MITRAEWGARPRKSDAGPFTGKAGFQLHHFASPRAKTDHALCDNDVRGVQTYHMDANGWSDIAYNFLVCNHGETFEGRGWDTRSGASASSACNGTRLAIVWMGHSDKDVFDIRAANAIKALEREGNTRGWPSSVVGHRDCSTSACPGDVLYWWMGQQTWTDDLPPTPPAPPPPGPVQLLILGDPTVSIGQMQRWAAAQGATRRFIELALYAFTASHSHGVDPAVTYAVMAHETAYGKFGGVLTPLWHNWGGIKTTSGGSNDDPEAHHRFDDDAQGVRAVAQHAGLYAGLFVPSEQIVDPRHFEAIRGQAGAGLPSLGWTWASGSHDENVVAKALGIQNTR